MALRSPFAGVQQGDVAFMEVDGVAYRCHVWLRMEAVTVSEVTLQRGVAVEAAVYTEQAHGQEVLLWRDVVRTSAVGEYVDCPRVVPFGTEFHVHWIEYNPTEATLSIPSGRDLHRSTFDVDASPYGWTHRGAIGTGWEHLYDTFSTGAADEYIIVHAPDPSNLSVRRVNGSDWIDTDWSLVQAASHDEEVLACWHDATAVYIAYALSPRMYAFTIDYPSGTLEDGPSIIANPSGTLTAIGMCQAGSVDSGEVFLVAEQIEAVELVTAGATIDLPSTLHIFCDDYSNLSNEPEVVTPNTTLQSKPWRFVSGDSVVADVPQFFAVLGYQAATVDREWVDSSHYVMRYEQESSALAGRPIPVSNLVSGIASAEKHGAIANAAVGSGISATSVTPRKRRNHVPSATPAPSFGPLVKTYTTLLGRWSRIDTAYVDSDTVGVVPAGAALRATRFHHDTPWAYPLDDTDPALPTVPFASVGVPTTEHAEAGAGLFLGGGAPQVYDGHRFVEASFPWRPEILLAADSGAGTSPAAGTYTYVAIYEWRDNRGQVHRSEPSEPVTLVGTGEIVDLAIRCCNISMKDNAALGFPTSGPVKVDIFRTEAGGSIFYPLFRGNTGLEYDLTNVPTNDPTTHLLMVEDAREDAEINGATPLPYTFVSGSWSPLPSETPPAMGAVTRWQNRVWGVSAEEPNRIWYSQEILPEQGGEQYSVPEFSGVLTYRIDGVGKVVAMREMDSALIIFTRDGVYALNGNPADATGQGSTLQLQTLQRGTGCVEPRSVASAPDGIYFQSRRGFYKLTRTNELQYVGADVEDELRTAGNVRAVTVHEDSHQCRILCGGSPYGDPQVLVYDWLMELWAVWPLPNAGSTDALSSPVDALIWRGHVGEHAHVVLQTAGVLVQKSSADASRYADEGSGDPVVAIPVDIRTGWVHLAGLAGFKRVRKIGIHLDKPAAAGFTVAVEYDLDGSQTDGSNLQTELVSSTSDGYVEVRTAMQKCRAIRIRVHEYTTDPTGSQLTDSTLNIIAITLVVARKPGLTRVSPTTQRT